MSPGARRLFAIVSLVPFLAVVLLAIAASNNPEIDRLMSLDVQALKHTSTHSWIVFGLLMGGTVFLQLGMGAVVGIYCEKRKDMTIGAKIGWTVACVFVGSFALPLFYLAVLRKHARISGS